MEQLRMINKMGTIPPFTIADGYTIRMYQEGDVDIRVLKDILGHESLNTTQIYTHVSNKHMEDAINKNPLATNKRKKNK